MPLRHDQRGASLVEYLLIVGLVALIAIAGFQKFGESTNDKVLSHANCVAQLSCGEGSATAAGAPTGETSSSQTFAPPSPVAPPKGLGERALDVAKGFVVDGIGGTIAGLWTMVRHPIQTAKGIGHAVAHPIQTAGAIKDGVKAAWNENPERLLGAGVFEVITLPAAALKATKASKLSAVAKVNSAADKVDDLGDASKIDNAAAVVAKTDKFALTEEQFIQMAKQGGLEPEKMTVYRFDSRPPDVIAKEGGLFPNPSKSAATSVEQHFEFGSTGSSTFVSTTVQEGNKAFVVGSDAPKTLVGMTDDQLIKTLETKLPNPDAPLPPPVEYVIYEYRGDTLAAKTNAKVHVHEQEALTRGISANEGLQVREVRVQRPWKKVGVEGWEPGDTVSIDLELPKNSTVTFGDWSPVRKP